MEASHLIGGLIGDGINLGMGVADYKRAREEGNSTGTAMAKAVGTFAWGEFYYGGLNMALSSKFGGPAAMAISIGLSIGTAAVGQVGQKLANNARVMTSGYRQAGKLGSGYFEMSQAGYTMRQRSLNAIRQNGLNTQSALGNEARMYFRASMRDD